MCGLSGAFTTRSADAAEERVSAMLTCQVHRGPDSAGVWSTGLQCASAAIGLRRLRVIDLSDAADQPMVSADGRHALVFNGEIYNYIELRDELVRLGHRFRTSADTEVLLAALTEWGPGALNRLNGMWALLKIDRATGEVIIARDRFGVKPLYWSSDGETCFVSSEIKGILQATPRKFRVNPRVANAYLRQALLDSTNETFFEGIQQFPAGHVLQTTAAKAAKGLLGSIPYWQLAENALPDPSWTEDGAIEYLRETFVDAVRIRLRSDVPVGVLLSGGTDSSSIAAAVRHLAPHRDDIRLISAVGGGALDGDERFIDAMALHLRQPVEKVALDYAPESALDLLNEVTWFNDEPLGGFTTVAHYLLMQRAKALGVTVGLSGQGSDENFCGYNKFLPFRVQELVRGGHWVKAVTTVRDFQEQKTVLPQFNYMDAKRYLPRWLRFSEVDVRGSVLLSDSSWTDVGGHGGVRARQLRDIQHLSVPALVHYEDRTSMSQSVELRLPFLDYRIVEFAMSIPTEFKLAHGWTKWILRKAMESLLPASIAWRKDKQGFTVPQNQWMHGPLQGPVARLLEQPWLTDSMGLVDRSKVRSAYAFATTRRGRHVVSERDLFGPIALEIWARRFSEHLQA
jgi:asparagine synthase (glutamine-hydrolysing)